MARLVLVLALVVAALGLRFGTFTAGGADAYGYVSQADLWLQGTLILEQPLGREAPWRDAVWTLSPLGYRPGDERGTMVPTYSPGLPMMMAMFKALGGSDALYLVVPLFGALGVWLTYVLGRRLAGPASGALAALALAASPAFLFQIMWPMSDVPAMTLWLAAVVLAGSGRPWSAAAAGLAASAAIMTRPNLITLAAPVLALAAMQPPTWRQAAARCAACGLMMLPGALVVGAINQHLYGSPFASGYGSVDTIYAAGHFWANLARYPRWLVETQTPFVLLALAAPVVAGRYGTAPRRVAGWGLVFAAVVFLTYAWYSPFDHWTYLRFLLPAYPVLLVLAAAAFSILAPRGRVSRPAAFAALAITLVAWGAWRGRPAFVVHDEESRYRAAGLSAGALPDSAVILANQHSGSLRYYGHRVTLRFEWLYPEVYQDALAYLRRAGHRVYAVLDDAEREAFRQRYGGVTDVTWLEREPLLVTAERVYFYEIPESSR